MYVYRNVALQVRSLLLTSYNRLNVVFPVVVLQELKCLDFRCKTESFIIGRSPRHVHTSAYECGGVGGRGCMWYHVSCAYHVCGITYGWICGVGGRDACGVGGTRCMCRSSQTTQSLVMPLAMEALSDKVHAGQGAGQPVISSLVKKKSEESNLHFTGRTQARVAGQGARQAVSFNGPAGQRAGPPFAQIWPPNLTRNLLSLASFLNTSHSASLASCPLSCRSHPSASPWPRRKTSCRPQWASWPTRRLN